MTKDELAVFERLTATMEAMQARLDTFTPGERSDPALEALTNGLKDLAAAQREIAAGQSATLRQIHRPQNSFPPEISVFNPRGDKDFPRPHLLCPVHPFFAMPSDPQTLTREEIELLNVLIQGGDAEYELKLTDGSKTTLQVKGEYVLGSKPPKAQHMTISHPSLFKENNKDRVPDVWLRRMLMSRKETKAQAAGVLTMEEERDLIELGLLNNKSVPADGLVVSVGA